MAGNKIIIVQGGQYGSEAKGMIAAVICEREKVDYAVRTGATNAGHTVYYTPVPTTDSPELGPAIPVKMQQLPTGWVNPSTHLIIGAGSLIDLAILQRECDEVSRLTGEDVKKRLTIDYRAGIHRPAHAERSAASGRHVAIGATGKGCSEALIDRIRGRGQGYECFGEVDESKEYEIADTGDTLNKLFDDGAKILLEGTQGQLLDLYFGPYPYTTHKPTGPAQWMVEAGLSPALPTDIVMVIRTFPIRVAGNSGPLPHETHWPAMAKKINNERLEYGLPPIVKSDAVIEFMEAVKEVSADYQVPSGSNGLDQHIWTAAQRVTYAKALSEINAEAMKKLSPNTVSELSKLFEFTTVTKKLRRVGMLYDKTTRLAALACRPHRLAVTFLNYLWPKYWYTLPPSAHIYGIHNEMEKLEKATGAGVSYMGWGPESEHIDGPMGVEAADAGGGESTNVDAR